MNGWLADRPIHHLVRACTWIAMVPIAIYFGWQDSVFVVFLYSTYANFASDLSAYLARKAAIEAES